MGEIRCAIVDFDGTLTELAREEAVFESLYTENLVASTTSFVRDAWADAAARVDADPDRYGFVLGESVVAPGNADHFIRCLAVTQVLACELELITPDGLRHAMINAYSKAYEEVTRSFWSADMFRPGVVEFLEYFREMRVPLWLVSNAEVTQVRKRLSCLPARVRGLVNFLGNAQKYWIGHSSKSHAAFDFIPDEQKLPGMARAVKLKRGRYFDALATVWDRTRTEAVHTLVVGDIYEMDLAMPAALGAHVHLVQRGEPRAPYRHALIALGERGSWGCDLAQIGQNKSAR